MKINMTAVESSNVAKIGYDDTTSTLYVEFKNATTYAYDAVPRLVYDQLLSADSVGKAMHNLVKKGGYTYRKLETVS